MSGAADFSQERLAATREFAHTMIVVDDEAWKAKPTTPTAGLRRPRRGTAATTPTQEELFQVRHSLDTEALIDSAMQLGLICSIVRPPKDKSIKAQVTLAAKRADIVCLDWELHEDAGDSATAIIQEICRTDVTRNGRLRLIAIYTGDTKNNKILSKVFDAFPETYRKRFELKRDEVCIQGNHGLRIVCLFKAHGVQLTGARKERQVRESELPKRLQKEFAYLAGGLLSNVALAAIASIRDSTHHVLAKMAASMDAPYFHHRATVSAASDAEEYGVEVVLSDLKNAVDKQGVAQKYAGPRSIAARIKEMANGAPTLKLKYENNGSKEFELSVDDVILLVTEGNAIHLPKIVAANKPAGRFFKEGVSSLFSANLASARSSMLQFAVLTGVRSHPGSQVYKGAKNQPKLGLGSILRDPKGAYFLCLQASCDSVRLKKAQAFIFTPMQVTDEQPDHVVPVIDNRGKLGWVGLATPAMAYAQQLSVRFEPDGQAQAVLAKKSKGRRGLFFSSDTGEKYKWVADLKQRRALRTAQKLGQSMARLGFDEFEPFRQN